MLQLYKSINTSPNLNVKKKPKPKTFRSQLSKPSCVGEHLGMWSHQLFTEYVLINWHEADCLNPC